MHHSHRAGAALRPLTGLVLPLAGVLALSACTTSGTGPASQGDGTDDDDGGACPGSGCVAGEDGSPGAPPSASYDSSGEVAVTLHPGPGAEVGSPTVVSFGAPFPPGALEDAAALRAFDGATEL